MSTILIRKRIEEEIARRLPVALLQAGVDYHTRRGIRSDCECVYCTYKRTNKFWGFRFYKGDGSSTRKYVFEQKVRPKFRTELYKLKANL